MYSISGWIEIIINGIQLQAPHIDRTDFLNGVVREKKRFENALDDSVAAGLNAGTEVLMNQVCAPLVSRLHFIASSSPLVRSNTSS